MTSEVIDIFFGQNSSWFWTMLQAIIVGLSLLFIYRQVRFQRYANMIVSLNSLRERWEAESMRNSRLAVCTRFRERNRKINEDCLYILSFFEEVGMYFKKGIFETDVLWGIYSNRAENYWLILEPMIKECRARYSDNTYYENFEYLKQRFESHSKKRGIQIKPKTEAELMAFAIEEIEDLSKLS